MECIKACPNTAYLDIGPIFRLGSSPQGWKSSPGPLLALFFFFSRLYFVGNYNFVGCIDGDKKKNLHIFSGKFTSRTTVLKLQSSKLWIGAETSIFTPNIIEKFLLFFRHKNVLYPKFHVSMWHMLHPNSHSMDRVLTHAQTESRSPSTHFPRGSPPWDPHIESLYIYIYLNFITIEDNAIVKLSTWLVAWLTHFYILLIILIN